MVTNHSAASVRLATWMGRKIDDLSRDELYEVIAALANSTWLIERPAALLPAIEIARRENDVPPVAFLERAETVLRLTDLEARTVKLCLERGRLQRCLKPREWTQVMHDAWHQALPDTVKAFEALELASREELGKDDGNRDD